jgi:phosphate:Na+ symporter
VHWISFSILLLGGLAIFLYGMTVMTNGLKAAAGKQMKLFLKGMTRNRWTSLFAGAGITTVIQSSSVTTVLAVGFVSAGLLSFQSTLGLILGANIGTTITAQIIAFKITKVAWIMVALGYLLNISFKKRSIKETGTILLGLGLVFLGMNVMSEATAPLKTYTPFIEAMEGLDNYFFGILIGIVFTAAVQSSSATTGVVIVLASQGLISTEVGITIILGANVGTCVTAIFSALGKPIDAMRVALSHVLYNVMGVVIWYAFIDQLGELVRFFPGSSSARQIANAHTVFNIANTVLFIGFVNPVARLILWILPLREEKEERLFPKLHSFYLENVSLALYLSQNAIATLGMLSLLIVKKGLGIALQGKHTALIGLRTEDKRIDKGHAEILKFLQQIQQLELSEKEIGVLEQQIEAVNVMESAADLITTDLVEAAEHRIEIGFAPTDSTIKKLGEVYNLAFDAFSVALAKYSGRIIQDDSSLDKKDFTQSFHDVRSHVMQRLSSEDENRISIYRFESEVLETIRRLHSLARRLERKAG